MTAESGDKELIVEYEPIVTEKFSITRNPCAVAGYVVHALKDTWIFPWRYKKVLININKIFIPYHTVGIVHEANKDYKVQTRFISDGPFAYVRVKSKFVPRKIHASDIIASLDIVQSYECQIVAVEPKISSQTMNVRL